MNRPALALAVSLSALVAAGMPKTLGAEQDFKDAAAVAAAIDSIGNRCLRIMNDSGGFEVGSSKVKKGGIFNRRFAKAAVGGPDGLRCECSESLPVDQHGSSEYSCDVTSIGGDPVEGFSEYGGNNGVHLHLRNVGPGISCTSEDTMEQECLIPDPLFHAKKHSGRPHSVCHDLRAQVMRIVAAVIDKASERMNASR